MSKTYSVKQVAEILGYSTNSIYTFLKEKRIKGVRLGHGRFRIPQSEIDRLTVGANPPKLSAPSIIKLTNIPPGKIDAVLDAPSYKMIDDMIKPSWLDPKEFNFYDWFLGISAIVIGLSILLYNQTMSTPQAGRYLFLQPVIQALLISGGIGLLLTDILKGKIRRWHLAFHGLLLLGLAGYAGFMWFIGDYDGAFLFGSMIIASLANWFGVGAIGSFSLGIFMITAIVGPGAILLFPTDPHIVWAYYGMPRYFYLFVVVLGVIGGTGLIVSYKKNSRLYFSILGTIAAVFIGLSFWFAMGGFWTRAFYLLLLGIIVLSVWIWRGFVHIYKSENRLVWGMFCGILLIFVLAIGVVGALQINMRQYAQSSLRQKLHYGVSFTEGMVEQVKVSMESAAQNTQIIKAIESKDQGALNGYSRNLLEANQYLYRVVITDLAGEILSYYPLSDSLTVSNVSFRDYFQQAVTTHNSILSGVFEAASQSRSKRVAWAVPVLDSNNHLIGTIIGGISLERLGHKLQQITTENRGEYMTVSDQAGVQIIHPDQARIGKSVGQDNWFREINNGKDKTIFTNNYKGDQTLVSAMALPKIGWVIAVWAPITGVFQSTTVAGLVVFAVSGLSLIVVILFVIFGYLSHPKIEVPEDDGGKRKYTDTS